MSNSKLFSMIDKAVFDYKFIEDGDNILIGASGGKDSTALLHYFSYRKKRGTENFTFAAVHIATEIGSPLSPELEKLYDSWGISVIKIPVMVLERLKEGRKMNCWWCSTQRRTELNKYAMANGFNKIALGHHLDDILETLLMNALNKGELSTMPPRLTYDKYPITIIRPLCFADVETIIAHGNANNFINATCTCDYQDNSGRKEARSRLSTLAKTPAEKRRFFMALRNVKMEYLTYPPCDQ
ncbi:MAG: tRNA 2-thiocytidine biosynthesis TtcA family protein [Treponemataceae bacterium]